MALFGIVAGVVAAELSLRAATGTFFLWGDPDVVDPMVGYLLRPGLSLRHPSGSFRVTIGDHSTRKNGNPEPPAERPLTLAVGDSFTFGEDVADEDTWPALLERLVGSRVINGGVHGFGIDQVVLRAEQLAGVYRPDTIVVSFIPDDVARAERSCTGGHAKPYFEVLGTGLRLHPAIVPPRGMVKELLSFSLAAHLVFYDFVHHDCTGDTVVGHAGEEIACRLMDRLAALGVEQQARVVVMLQPEGPSGSETAGNDDTAKRVLACAAARGLFTFDLFPVIGSIPLEERSRLFSGHMTPEGNGVVARELAAFLRARRTDAPVSSEVAARKRTWEIDAGPR